MHFVEQREQSLVQIEIPAKFYRFVQVPDERDVKSGARLMGYKRVQHSSCVSQEDTI